MNCDYAFDVNHNLAHMETAFKSWKNDTFGMVRKKKKELHARLQGIQKAFHEGKGNKYLSRLERKLQQEFSTINSQEEFLWHQRSRAKWLRNTQYYHLKTVIRRRKNHVQMLRNSAGSWVDDPATLKVMVNSYYKNLFTNNVINREWFQTAITFPRIGDC